MRYLHSLKISFADKGIMLLLLGWVIVQALLLWKNGIVTGLEAEKYITEANYFLHYGKLSSDNFYLYFTQIFLIAAAIKLQLNYVVVVVLQLLLNLLALIMFYKLALDFLQKPLISFLAAFFFMINVPYQVYNSFLFTESIFYSLTIIYSSYLLRLDKLTIKRLLLLSFFLFILSITRPTGVLFFAATIIYIFFRFLGHLAVLYKALIILGSLIFFLTVINVMLDAGGSLDFMLPFKRENIICGVNTVSDAQIKTFEKGNSVQGILYYIINNDRQFFKLAKLKTLSFFGMLRTYYSLFHNIFLIIFFYPFYALSIAGIWKRIQQKDKRFIYMVTVILLYWITTVITCDDWHNRFILTVSPFLFLLGFAAFSHISKKTEAGSGTFLR